MCSAWRFCLSCSWIYRLETWLFFTWVRPLFLCAGFVGGGTLMSSAALKSISCSCSCTMIACKVSLNANSPHRLGLADALAITPHRFPLVLQICAQHGDRVA